MLRWVAYLLTPRRYALVQAKFSRFGNRLMFVARFLPGLRSPIFLTAGMTRRVTFLRFILLDGFAALISVPVWVYLGHYGAQNHEWLLKWLGRSKVILFIAVLTVVALIVRYFWRRSARMRTPHEHSRTSPPPFAFCRGPELRPMAPSARRKPGEHFAACWHGHRRACFFGAERGDTIGEHYRITKVATGWIRKRGRQGAVEGIAGADGIDGARLFGFNPVVGAALES